MLALPTALAAQDSAMHHHMSKEHGTHALQWGPAPAAFPAGAKAAVVSGETISVKQGVFLIGMGDTVDAAKTKAMAPGSTATMNAGTPHFATAKG
jgi:hypothetical protein